MLTVEVFRDGHLPAHMGRIRGVSLAPQMQCCSGLHDNDVVGPRARQRPMARHCTPTLYEASVDVALWALSDAPRCRVMPDFGALLSL
jgi:hypothetical protein